MNHRSGDSATAALLLISLTTPSASAQITAVGTIAGGASVSGVIDGMRKAATDVIKAADDSVSVNAFRVRQQMEILLGQLDLLSTGVIDKTFAELNATERKTFADLNASLARLADLERVTADDAAELTREASVAIGNLPFAKETPRVTGFTPAYVRSGAGSTVRVAATGFLLGNGTPTFEVARRACKLLTKTETRVEFGCPATLFRATNEVAPVTGELTVYEKPTWWQQLKSWFQASPLPRRYTLSVFAVPPRMGTYSVSAIASDSVVETKQRSQDFSHANDHCEGNRDIQFPFNVTPNWEIVTASISPNCTSSSKSRCQGLRDVSDKSFGYMVSVRNSGTCGPAWKDGRGSVRGTVSWTETRSMPTDQTVELPDGELSWGRATRIALPANTKAAVLTINQIDGTKSVVTNTSGDLPWARVQLDLPTRSLIITPRTLDAALSR